MKLKLGLKHYNVVKITNFKGKIFLKNPENNILFYPNTNFIKYYVFIETLHQINLFMKNSQSKISIFF